MAAGQEVLLVSRHPEEWHSRFVSLQSRIRTIVPGAAIEHIGSTAVVGMPAKDVVDLLVGVDFSMVATVAEALRDAEWDLEGFRAGHAWLSMPDRGARTAVVHVVEHGGAQWRDRVAFRDLLRRSADARQRYLRAKMEAAQESAGWGEYTAAKAATVASLLEGCRGRGEQT